MKTFVLQLEAHDDATSVIDKMNWGKTGRLLLVWPQSAKVLNHQVDLVLIQRHSLGIGMQLGLVSRDPEVLFFANNLGIPVFNSLQQAQRKNWHTHRRSAYADKRAILAQPSQKRDITRIRQKKPQRNPWSTQPISRLVFFTSGVIALFALAAVLVPSATIILQPGTYTQEVTLPILADPSVQNIKLTGEIPARVKKIIVEGQKSIPVSGTTSLPDQFASGEILITNLTENPIVIPPGLILLTKEAKPIRFQTIEGGDLTAGNGNIITLTIRALLPGISGNLPENSLVAVEGPLGVNIASNNPKPTTGGSNILSPMASTADRKILLENLQAELIQTAQQELISELSNNDQLLSEIPIAEHILESSYTPEDNTPADQITLKAQVEYQFLIVAGEDILKLAQSVGQANLPKGYVLVPGTFEITAISKPDKNGTQQIKFKQVLQAHIEPNQVIALAQGQPPEEMLKQIMSTLTLAKTPSIRLSPSWWPRMPLLPIRIRVQIQPVG
jgi:hypothetical protein